MDFGTVWVSRPKKVIVVLQEVANSPVRFDVAGAGDGVTESLNGTEAGNGGHSQGASCTPLRRFSTGLKYECLNQFVIFGQRHLRHLIKEFVDHYMTERFHQGIGGQLIRNVGPTNDNGADGKVVCRARLGGLLNFYHREAA